MIKKMEKLYEGKAKILYTTDDPRYLIQEFKDSATAFDGKKKGEIKGKGACNNKISAKLFQILEAQGLKTHFVQILSETEMLVKRVSIFPLEVVVRNLIAGSMAKRLGLEEGEILEEPVVEYYLKNDSLGDPLLTDDHIRVLRLLEPSLLARVRDLSLKTNDILSSFLKERNLRVVDFKLEFGRNGGEILIADEISPDTCRLWDLNTGEKLDKDRFRRDLGGVEEAYQEVLKRITG